MRPLCLSRGEEDESRVNGGQQLPPVAMHTDLHIRGFQGLHVFWFQLIVKAQFAFSFVALAVYFAAFRHISAELLGSIALCLWSESIALILAASRHVFSWAFIWLNRGFWLSLHGVLCSCRLLRMSGKSWLNCRVCSVRSVSTCSCPWGFCFSRFFFAYRLALPTAYDELLYTL